MLLDGSSGLQTNTYGDQLWGFDRGRLLAGVLLAFLQVCDADDVACLQD